MLNGMTHSAYQNTSQRFSALQQLINRIATAHDPKAIQDLQARIQAEQNMLTNEQTKLQSLYQIARAEEAAQQQRLRERAATDVGSVRAMSVVSY
jgi:type IV secretion system protein VirB5